MSNTCHNVETFECRTAPNACHNAPSGELTSKNPGGVCEDRSHLSLSGPQPSTNGYANVIQSEAHSLKNKDPHVI